MCMCKNCKANTWWWFRLYLLLLYQCTQAIHISDLGLADWIDVKSTLRQICCPKLCLDFVWSLKNFIQVHRSPSQIVHIIVLDDIRQNLLEHMEVLIPDSRGSQHLPIWAASACRTMPHPLRWQHNSSLVFWSHAFTPIQQCSIMQIMWGCKDDEANPYNVVWLVRVVFLTKRKPVMFWTVALATGPFSSTFMSW